MACSERPKICETDFPVIHWSVVSNRGWVGYAHLEIWMGHNGAQDLFYWCHQHKPTVSLGVTCAVVCTYGCDDGRIVLTRCAIIAAGLDGRCRPRRTCRTPPAAARSARNALAAGLRPVSTADPGAFPRSRTTLPAGIRPCGDASPPRSVPGIRPCLPHLCLV